ncbi:hypothetical protein [Methylorubrum suomiense]|uniref:Uncharacterized protein n=1 Tax=Methylorubrum suomiense TaxID=144191 RepID=A0ABQ4V0E7_9HYPH|nr:hypothetical protein [Methylorubrum suomiense]GJE78071.1 hypothetical protein BGCPKDLD_4682 [Methylorubrum suomiense]
MAERKVRHAHELEAAGEPRWSARMKDGLLMVTDEASGEEFQATAYTTEGDGVRFSLPGENGLRFLAVGAPGHEEFLAVLEKQSPLKSAPAKPAPEKKVA